MGSSPSPTLRRLRLKPEDCDPTELFVQWRCALGEVFEVRATPSEIAAFRGEIDVHASARYVLSASRNSPLSLVRRSASAAQGRIAICLQINGSATGLAGDGAMRADPGDVMFVDLSQSLTMRQSAPDGLVDGVTLWTARDRILPLVSDENALHGLVLKAESPAGAVIGATMRAFAGSAPKMRLTDFDAIAEGLVALAAKSIAPALARAGDRVVPPPLATFVTVRRYIDRKLASPDLSANSIAAEFGLSRASLYRLFEPAGGIAKYIRKVRLSRAYQEITAAEFSNRRIGFIAYQLGFKNVSAFSRLFHEVYGVTPGEARARAPDRRQARIRRARRAGRIPDPLARRPHRLSSRRRLAVVRQGAPRRLLRLGGLQRLGLGSPFVRLDPALARGPPMAPLRQPGRERAGDNAKHGGDDDDRIERRVDRKRGVVDRRERIE
jgi:AraC-like DNA-binding protein